MKLDRAIDPASTKPRRQNVFRIPEYVRTTHGADGAAVLDILRGQMFRLNFVGSIILELLKQGKSETEIGEQVAHEFGVDRARAEADVRELIESLEKHHLLAEHGVNSAA